MNGHDDSGNPLIFYDREWEQGTNEEFKFSLGHSCERWVIGDINEAKKFYVLLGSMINLAEANSEHPLSTGSEY